jgi:CubicO group peptidase (beta-lactamase class C family)
MPENISTGAVIHGAVSPGFEGVRQAFLDNFAHRHELGGACAAYVGGEKVVDLWAGLRDEASGEPWQRDTLVVVHSASKGLAAMTLAIAHSRGWLDYEERVAHYWPEFAQHGKERTTVRQLLAHQAGLFAINEPVSRSTVADLDRLAAVLARQTPAWEPGSRQAYHALSLGFYEGELVRRIDPKHRSLGQFFQDEIASVLGEDVYLRLPENIPNARLARVSAPGRVQLLLGFPFRLAVDIVNPMSNITGRSRSTPAPRCISMMSASMRAIWKCRPAGRWPRRAASHTPTASLRPMAANSASDRGRWNCWPPPPFRRPTAFMTSAFESTCSSPLVS